MADDIVISLPVGARVLVVADLRLGVVATDESSGAAGEVARAIAAWSGPGAVVVAGDLFDIAGDAAIGVPQALAAHGSLGDALRTFAGGAGRRVVVMPGRRDPWLTWPAAAEVLFARTGAEVAPALLLELSTAAGTRAVRIEPGHRLHPAATNRHGLVQPGYPRLGDVLPGVWRGSTSGWLAGMSELDDPDAASRFVASRLVYRQFGRRAWLLAVPALVALLARLPVDFLRPARHVAGALLTTALVAAALELVVLVALAAVSLRQVWLAFSGKAGGPRDINEPARAASRELVADGLVGLVTAGTGRAELSRVGNGFYANAGCCAEVVREYAPRFGGAGLPSPFLASRQIAWVELEAGNELHARLLYGEVLVPGATAAERLLARVPGAGAGSVPVPVVVSSFPHGEPWPRVVGYRVPHRRTRRLAALVVAAAGLVSVLSALSGPVANRLRALRQVLPLAVPQAAGALAALGGIALIMLARGIRRGQRRAYVVCQVTLIVVALLHILRADSVIPAIVALGVAAFLWLRRGSFRAASDLPPVHRGLLLLGGLAGTAVLTGTLTLEGSSWASIKLHHRSVARIGWRQAFLATIERMVAVENVRLPDRLNGFFTPAMFATTAGLVVVAAWMVFRPVVARRPRARTAGNLERARGVVDRYGAGTLDYFALRADKQFYFWAGSVVAYAVYSGVCLVSPDPVGPLAQREWPGEPFVTTRTPMAGPWPCSGHPKIGSRSTGRRACTTFTWGMKPSSGWRTFRSTGASSRASDRR